MKVLFTPASGLMNRLSYAMKFAVIGFLVVLPFGYVTYLQRDISNERIDFNQEESYGVEYTTPVYKMLQQIQARRAYYAGKIAGLSKDAEIVAADAAVDRLIPVINAIDLKYRKEFSDTDGKPKTMEKWEGIKKLWVELKAKQFATQADSFKAHTDICGEIDGHITDYIGNYSNLILDPDLDSYWLMDAFCIDLPDLAETIGKSAVLTMDARSRQTLSADERIELSALYKIASTLMADLESQNIKTAFQENDINKNPKVKGKVRPALQQSILTCKAAVNSYCDFLKDKVLTPAKIEATDTELIEGSNKAIAAVIKFYDDVGPQLDNLCLARVETYKTTKTLAIITAIGAVIVLTFLFLGFYFSVQTSVSQLAGATKRMIAGTTESFKLDSRDELGQVAQSYNDINKALTEARTLRSNTEKENKLLQENILQLLHVVADAADGNLTVRARVTEGALGNVADALNQMLDSWMGLTTEIKTLIARTQEALADIRASAERMTAGATQQASQILGASGSIQKMSASIQGVSENAETAAAAAKRTQETALAGSESVQNVVRGMELLRTNVQAGAKKIKNLGDRSMEITTIVATIAKISDQTNMLALNAAIEAARAGEHGRGFSVVADEVRKLAERTAAATQEIEKLVKDIQAETNESVAAIEQQTQVVEEESHVVSQAGDNLVKIQEVSTQSAELVGEINSSAKAQVEGAATVVKSMEHISQIAQQTQRGADGTLAITGELAKLVVQLSQIVGHFKVQEQSAPAPAARPARHVAAPVQV